MEDPLPELARLEGVGTAVAAAEAAVQVALQDRGRRRVTPAWVSWAARSEVDATAQLTAAPGRWLPGCERLQAELANLAQTIGAAPGQALARMHVLAGRFVISADQLGRLRPGADSARLAALFEILTGTGTSLLRAAVAHAELLSLQPFAEGSDVVARAAEHAVLINGGVDPSVVLPVALGHAAAGEGYRAAFGRYQTGTAGGVAAWLVHCAQAVTVSAEHSAVAAQR